MLFALICNAFACNLILGSKLINWSCSACYIGVGGGKTEGSPNGNSSSEFDVFALSRYVYASRDVRDVRDVSCVRRRARDRSITRGADLARNRAEAKAIWAVLCYCCCSCCARSRHASRGHGSCPFAGFVRTSNGILTIPGGHGKDIDPLC